MQVGIDSFAAWDNTSLSLSPSDCLRKLIDQIELNICTEKKELEPVKKVMKRKL
jgi:hypothetical protein